MRGGDGRELLCDEDAGRCGGGREEWRRLIEEVAAIVGASDGGWNAGLAFFVVVSLNYAVSAEAFGVVTEVVAGVRVVGIAVVTFFAARSAAVAAGEGSARG